MTRTNLALVLSTGILILFASMASATDKVSEVFLRDFMRTNLAEIQLSELAQKQSQDADVLSFAQSLANDASASYEQAENLAAQIGLAVPSGPSTKQKDVYAAISKLSGPAFERAFVKEIIADHRANVPRFQNEAKKNDDPVGNFARQMLPMMQKQLDAAQSLHLSL